MRRFNPPRRLLITAVTSALLLFAAPQALSNTAAPEAAPETDSPWTLTAKGGVSLFTTSVSKVPEHFLKPALRFEAMYRISARLSAGIELGALVTDDVNYAFESVSAVFQTPLYDGEHLRLVLGWGFGLGTGPPVLSSDLLTKATIVPTMQASIGLIWRVVPDRFELGLAIIDEQLTVVTGALTAGFPL